MKTVITTVKIGRHHRAMEESKTDLFKPEAVNHWEFDCRETTIKDDLAAAREVTSQGLISTSGAYDRDAVALCKGLTILKQTMESGRRILPDGEGISLSKNDLDNLPKGVVMEFYLQSEFTTRADEAEAMALKNDSTPLLPLEEKTGDPTLKAVD